ncbi:hypothetical protein H7U19_03400 [Hyunsoonleella sp. SJ7]|uniref:Uncharacterized protein n=2 Tax=Hyunsoonleella aquatilis TaxID=2762758 RepID=A0A923HAK2_9FLAO|nr:hypothetical protein [Hyunsoonleella aquatilis]
MICWNISDYYGGMIIHFLQYWYIVLPILILYIISLIRTLILVVCRGLKTTKFLIISHSIFLIFLIVISLIESDTFKSERVMTAILKDDLFHYTLILREDGTCENNVNGFLGFKEQFSGTYKIDGDTIIFTQKPYDNNFIPDTLLLDKKQNAIFINRDKEGKFNTEKEWLNHFKIR